MKPTAKSLTQSCIKFGYWARFAVIAAGIWYSPVRAQTSATVDSLKTIIQSAQQAGDRQRTSEALFALCNHYYDAQDDAQALQYLQAAMEQAPENNSILWGRMLFRKGMLVYFSTNDLAQSLALMDSAYVLLKNCPDPTVTGPFLRSYGPFLSQSGQYQKAKIILLQAEQDCLRTPATCTNDHLLNLYSNLLSATVLMGDYVSALEFARKGIETGKNSQNYELIADLYYNNALTLVTLGYQKDAENSYLKSLELNKKGNISKGIITVTTALGEHYTNNGQSNLGMQYLTDAIAAATQIQDFYAVAVAEKMASNNYLSQKNYTKALETIDRCILFFEQHPDIYPIQGIYLNKATILLDSGQPDAAITFAEKELKLAHQANSYSLIANSSYLCAKIEQKRNNLGSAIAYLEEYAAYKDTMYNTGLEARLAQERTRQNVEAEQDSRQKAELEARLLSSRNQLLATITGALLLLLAAGSYLYRQLRQSRHQLETQNQQLTQLNQTKDKFFGIIAHDLRNPLTAFQGIGEQLEYYLAKGDTVRLHRMTAQITQSAQYLSGLLDNLLSWALLNRGTIPFHPETLSLSEETTAALTNHENAAAAKNIRLKNHIPNGLKVHADRNALQTILRNLIGNAIKFTETGGLVTIGCNELAQQVMITVSDTGTGISAEKIGQLFSLDKRSVYGTAGEKGTGLGLILCKELVELHAGVLRPTSTLGKGSIFEFSLPKTPKLTIS